MSRQGRCVSWRRHALSALMLGLMMLGPPLARAQGLPPPDYREPPITATDDEACNLVRFALDHPEWWQRQVSGWEAQLAANHPQPRPGSVGSYFPYRAASRRSLAVAWLASYLVGMDRTPHHAPWVLVRAQLLDRSQSDPSDWARAEAPMAEGIQRCGLDDDWWRALR